MNAHDVRHLTVCTRCNDIGDRRHMLTIDGATYHGRCAIQKLGIDALTKLPLEATDKLQLGDIGHEAMTELLEHRCVTSKRRRTHV